MAGLIPVYGAILQQLRSDQPELHSGVMTRETRSDGMVDIGPPQWPGCFAAACEFESHLQWVLMNKVVHLMMASIAETDGSIVSKHRASTG